MGKIYLLHFDMPYCHAQHYLGYSENLEGRLWHHKRGTGAKLTRAASQAGIKWTVVRTWMGDQSLERKLHKSKNNPKLCPICNPKTWERRYSTTTQGDGSHGSEF